MTTTTHTDGESQRLASSIRLVLRRYGAQVRRHRAMATGALLLPAVGDVLTYYTPPLVVAKLLGTFARSPQLAAADLTPFVLTFAALWLSGQVVWRIAGALIARVDFRMSRRARSL